MDHSDIYSISLKYSIRDIDPFHDIDSFRNKDSFRTQKRYGNQVIFLFLFINVPFVSTLFL